MNLNDFLKFALENNDPVKLGKALASKTRITILKVIDEHPGIDISRLAEALGQTQANISAQVFILDKAGLLKFDYVPGEHGVSKKLYPLNHVILKGGIS